MAKDSCRIFYAADLHGSDVCFRKWVNAARVYKVDALVLGGDIAGKVVVPIIRTGAGTYSLRWHGEALDVDGPAHLEDIRARIRRSGFYEVIMEPEEKAVYDQQPEKVANDLFPRVAKASLRSWLSVAEERLRNTGVEAYMMPGNDDYPDLAGLLHGEQVQNVDERVVELPGGFEMLSLGYSNPTPWSSPRELPEQELADRIDKLAQQLRDPSHAIFNIHCPPYASTIDEAAMLDPDYRPRTEGGQVLTGPVGSTAVRGMIERYQPMLGLHGHIHESPGSKRIGRTTVLNPGSDYGDGVLRGIILNIDKKKGIRSWQIIQG